MGGRRWLCLAISPVPSITLWDPCREPSLVLEMQSEVGAGSPLRPRLPPPPGKAWSGGWRRPQM